MIRGLAFLGGNCGGAWVILVGWLKDLVLFEFEE